MSAAEAEAKGTGFRPKLAFGSDPQEAPTHL
jgi:hypothetical protein